MDAVQPHFEQGTMSFGDHLDELRRRVFLALIAPLPLAIVAFFFSGRLIEVLLDPLFEVYDYHDLPLQVQELAPAEFLMARLKLSIIFALVISAPWILWQAWKFISPGLFAYERRFVYLLLPGSAVLTVAGAALLYFLMLPLMLHVLIMFGATLKQPATVVPAAPEQAEVSPGDVPESAGFEILDEDPPSPYPGQAWIKMPERALRIAMAPSAQGAIEIAELSLAPPSRLVQQYRISEYINFVLVLLLGIVIAFQMPLVILLLGWLGIASAAWLRSQRRYALLLCAIIAAVITPADAISMLAMLIPLYALYELGILLLVIAPAGAVAEGRFRWRPDKSRAQREEVAPPSQSTSSVPRREADGENGEGAADDVAGDDRDAP